MKDEFLETAGYTLDKSIKKNFRGDARDLLRAVARGNGHGEGWFSDWELGTADYLRLIKNGRPVKTTKKKKKRRKKRKRRKNRTKKHAMTCRSTSE